MTLRLPDDNYSGVQESLFCSRSFLLNRSQRLLFDVSSPNGILLFRETSKMITTYGTQSGNVLGGSRESE